MTTRDIFQLIKRRRWTLVWMTVLTTVLVAGLLALRPEPPPRYKAAATLRLSSAIKTTNYDRAQFTYVELARSTAVLVETIRRLDLALSPSDLLKQITVEPVSGTELIRVVGYSTDPEQAVALANTVATILVEKDKEGRPANSQTELLQSQAAVTLEQLIQDKAALALLLLNYRVIQPGEQEALQAKISTEQKAYEDLVAQLVESRVADAMNANSLNVYEPALSVELEKRGAQGAAYLALGAFTGLLAGVGLAFMQDSLDTRIRSAQELERRLGVPVLALIPRMPRNSLGKVDEMAVTEAFRTLQAYVLAEPRLSGNPLKSVMVASPSPREGKSFVAARLATALAASGRSVILVDLDLRRPSIHTQFGLANSAGVSDLLGMIAEATAAPSDSPDRLDAASASRMLRPTRFPGLRVLTTGPLPPNPVRLLAADRALVLLERLESMAEIVIVDSPALLGLADSLVLAPLVDGVLLVASSGQSTEEHVVDAAEQLKRLGARIVGVALNRALLPSRGVYDYYRQAAQHGPTGGIPQAQEPQAGRRSATASTRPPTVRQ